MTGAIRFVGGNPSDDEVAVVTAVLIACAGAAAAQAAAGAKSRQRQEPMWGRPAHVRHGRPRSWHESRLPR